MERHYEENGLKDIGVKRNFLQEILYKWYRFRKSRYAYPVMYADGMVSRLKCDRIGRVPLGVIFENHLITLEDSPTKMLWNEAMAYCRSLQVLGHECDGGHIDFWEKVVNLESNEQRALDTLLVKLGGKVLGRKWRWSESEYDYFDAWIFLCVLREFDVNLKNSNYSGYVVRPVLDMSKVSV